MEIQVVINDVKGKAETYAAQAQDVFKTSVEVAKQANGIFVGSVQTLAKTESAAAKDCTTLRWPALKRPRRPA